MGFPVEVNIDMREIIFLVEDAADGGYTARALGYSIYTEGETLDALKQNIRDAVKCHFDEKDLPRMARLHTLRDEIMAL